MRQGSAMSDAERIVDIRRSRVTHDPELENKTIRNRHPILLPAVLLLFAAACMALSTPAVSQDMQADTERILLFRSDITVHEDSSMTVQETIQVVSTGNEIQRGIYRDFPTRYKGKYGSGYVVGFEVVEVLRDGKPEPYQMADRENGKRVYIGDPDVYLSPGVYTYSLTYKTNRQLGYFEDHDELYWNVTGNGWVFPIEKATAEVVLPQDVRPEKIAAESYTGPEGSEGTMAEYSIDPTSRVVRFQTTRPLGSYEGLTIVVTWPTGFVQRPSQGDKALYFVQDHSSGIIGILGFVLVLVYYLVTWSKVGNDPERRTVVPQWEIPDGLSPAAIRFVKRMGYDNKTFASAILNMAVKRYIKIIKEEKTYTLQKDEAAQGVLATEEQMVADSLFKLGDSIELRDDNHVTIGAALRLLNYDLNNRYAAKYFARNIGYVFPGLALSVLVLSLSAKTQIVSEPGAIVALAIPFAIVNFLFYRLLRCITIPGRRLLDKVEGLRMYLAIAEQDRLNLLNPPERTPELFEQFLPYALALDVEHQWAEQFTAVLASAGVEGRPYEPTWYAGDSWHDLGSGGFVSSVGDSLAGAIASSSTAPGSSSGGGGGGSSGGGGGGGGGGGW